MQQVRVEGSGVPEGERERLHCVMLTRVDAVDNGQRRHPPRYRCLRVSAGSHLSSRAGKLNTSLWAALLFPAPSHPGGVPEPRAVSGRAKARNALQRSRRMGR